jgi:hypothetical protein
VNDTEKLDLDHVRTRQLLVRRENLAREIEYARCESHNPMRRHSGRWRLFRNLWLVNPDSGGTPELSLRYFGPVTLPGDVQDWFANAIHELCGRRVDYMSIVRPRLTGTFSGDWEVPFEFDYGDVRNVRVLVTWPDGRQPTYYLDVPEQVARDVLSVCLLLRYARTSDFVHNLIATT